MGPTGQETAPEHLILRRKHPAQLCKYSRLRVVRSWSHDDQPSSIRAQRIFTRLQVLWQHRCTVSWPEIPGILSLRGAIPLVMEVKMWSHEYRACRKNLRLGTTLLTRHHLPHGPSCYLMSVSGRNGPWSVRHFRYIKHDLLLLNYTYLSDANHLINWVVDRKHPP